MNQRKLDPEEEERKKKNGEYEAAFEATRHTFAGFAVSVLRHLTDHLLTKIAVRLPDEEDLR